MPHPKIFSSSQRPQRAQNSASSAAAASRWPINSAAWGGRARRGPAIPCRHGCTRYRRIGPTSFLRQDRAVANSGRVAISTNISSRTAQPPRPAASALAAILSRNATAPRPRRSSGPTPRDGAHSAHRAEPHLAARRAAAAQQPEEMHRRGEQSSRGSLAAIGRGSYNPKFSGAARGIRRFAGWPLELSARMSPHNAVLLSGTPSSHERARASSARRRRGGAGPDRHFLPGGFLAAQLTPATKGKMQCGSISTCRWRNARSRRGTRSGWSWNFPPAVGRARGAGRLAGAGGGRAGVPEAGAGAGAGAPDTYI